MTRAPLVPSDAPEVILYERPGCHLCEVAAHQLRALQASVRFRLTTVNIEDDEELERRFLLEIPVVAVAGEVVTQAPIDLGAVRAAVVAATTWR